MQAASRKKRLNELLQWSGDPHTHDPKIRRGGDGTSGS
jgi:hypothetical protein